jgi:hypothetical protein
MPAQRINGSRIRHRSIRRRSLVLTMALPKTCRHSQAPQTPKAESFSSSFRTSGM